MPLPFEFECPVCHSKETIAKVACADEPSIPQGTFVALEHMATPIQHPSSLLGPFIKAIICHYDICANCGTRYCTKAEKGQIPVTVQQSPHNSPRFDPQSHRRL